MTDISFQALTKNVSITHYTAVKIETSESNERRNSEGKNIVSSQSGILARNPNPINTGAPFFIL